MQSKCFYFGDKEKFTIKIEIRDDGYILFEDLNDQMRFVSSHVEEEEILDFANFLVSSGEKIKNIYKK